MIFAMLIWGASWPSGKIVGEYSNPNIIMVWRSHCKNTSASPFSFFYQELSTIQNITAVMEC